MKVNVWIKSGELRNKFKGERSSDWGATWKRLKCVWSRRKEARVVFCNSVQYRNYCWERIYNNKKNWISVLSNVAHHPVTTTELNQIGV